jgi:hypothetical protein
VRIGAFADFRAHRAQLRCDQPRASYRLLPEAEYLTAWSDGGYPTNVALGTYHGKAWVASE